MWIIHTLVFFKYLQTDTVITRYIRKFTWFIMQSRFYASIDLEVLKLYISIHINKPFLMICIFKK